MHLLNAGNRLGDKCVTSYITSVLLGGPGPSGSSPGGSCESPPSAPARTPTARPAPPAAPPARLPPWALPPAPSPPSSPGGAVKARDVTGHEALPAVWGGSDHRSTALHRSKPRRAALNVQGYIRWSLRSTAQPLYTRFTIIFSDCFSKSGNRI
jgi:hypothetical protein